MRRAIMVCVMLAMLALLFGCASKATVSTSDLEDEQQARIETIIETETAPVEGRVTYTDDPTLYVGVSVVDVEPKDGQKVLTYEVTLEDGVEVSRRRVGQEVVQDAVNGSGRQGTKERAISLWGDGDLATGARLIIKHASRMSDLDGEDPGDWVVLNCTIDNMNGTEFLDFWPDNIALMKPDGSCYNPWYVRPDSSRFGLKIGETTDVTFLFNLTPDSIKGPDTSVSSAADLQVVVDSLSAGHLAVENPRSGTVVVPLSEMASSAF